MIENLYSFHTHGKGSGIGVAVIAIVSISDRISLNFLFAALQNDVLHQ
ncbi:MAG: hypothetical protein CM15mP58_19780 [Burkholderiaceae bacterium]|nr:MAG: hypothetical protein CM15mP58_19780 [Burkholderiaceae bacterium]